MTPLSSCPKQLLASVRDANATAAARRRQRSLRQFLRMSERRHGPGRDAAPHLSTLTEYGQGRGEGSRVELHGDGPDASSSPGDNCLGTRKWLPPGCVQHFCLRLLDHRNGFSGTTWSRSWTSCPWCTLPCRRWGLLSLLCRSSSDRSSSSRGSGRGVGRSSPCSAGG